MTSDVEIVAKSDLNANACKITFNGTNCTINGHGKSEDPYVKVVEKNTDLDLVILPDDGYYFPTDLDVTIDYEGPGKVVYKEDEHIIQITHIGADATINAISQPKPDVCVTSFYCAKCKAGTSTDEASAKYDYINRRSSEEEGDIVLHLFPDPDYILPDEISVTFGGQQGGPGDYTYDKANQTITIHKNASALIRLDAESHIVTFDAGIGTFAGGNKQLSIAVKDGALLSTYLDSIPRPTFDFRNFGFYTYSDDTLIDYSTKVTQDITIKAYYFPEESIPYSNLDELADDSGSPLDCWSIISAVASTNSNIRECFSLGATKTVNIDGKSHQTRIIGFRHDQTAEGDTAVITFEFDNLITKSNGTTYLTRWDEVGHWHFLTSTFNVLLNGDDSTPGVIYEMLPDDLTNVIKTVTKKVGMYDDEKAQYTLATYNTGLFPLAYNEYTKDPGEVVVGEGSQYEWYETNSMVKKSVGSDTANIYWTRSLCLDNNRHVMEVNAEGNLAIADNVINTYAFAPAFCI